MFTFDGVLDNIGITNTLILMILWWKFSHWYSGISQKFENQSIVLSLATMPGTLGRDQFRSLYENSPIMSIFIILQKWQLGK